MKELDWKFDKCVQFGFNEEKLMTYKRNRVAIKMV